MLDERADVPTCMTIAGSDSGGGAGIQADLKAFARCGVHGTVAITAITAQSTVEVSGVEPVSPSMIVEQVSTVAADIPVGAVKIGMLGDEATIEAVDEALELLDAPIVLDPVMVAESGAPLLAEGAVRALTGRLFPRAAVVTPNVLEAAALTGSEASAAQTDLARGVHELGAAAVIVTGGHTEGGADLLFDGREEREIGGPLHPGGASHGSGCTHSSALAAFLARGEPLADAARLARLVAAEAVGNGLRGLGAGAGPVDALGLVGSDPEQVPRALADGGGGAP